MIHSLPGRRSGACRRARDRLRGRGPVAQRTVRPAPSAKTGRATKQTTIALTRSSPREPMVGTSAPTTSATAWAAVRTRAGRMTTQAPAAPAATRRPARAATISLKASASAMYGIRTGPASIGTSRARRSSYRPFPSGACWWLRYFSWLESPSSSVGGVRLYSHRSLHAADDRYPNGWGFAAWPRQAYT